jgi:hypothetical protein
MKSQQIRSQLQVNAIALARAVQSITNDRVPQSRQVAANLVFSPCLNPHINQ